MWRLPRLGALRCVSGVMSAAGAAKIVRCEDTLGEATKTDDTDLDFDMSGESSLEEGLKAPGPLESWDGEARRLTGLNTFLGAKIEVAKPLSPNFVMRHSAQLGSSPSGQGSEHYSCSAQVFNENVICVGTLDQNGAVEGHIIVPKLGEGVSSKLILYMSGKNDMFFHDVEFAGETLNAGFRWGNNVMGWQGPMCQVSYTQAVSPQLSLGAEAQLLNGLATPASTVTAKYDTPDDTWVGTLKSHFQPCGEGEDGMAELNLLYHRKVVKERVNLAAGLQVVPGAMHAASSFGAEFALHQSTVSTAWQPAQGHLQTTVTVKHNQAMQMTLSAEAFFGQQNPQTGEKADAFRFGYGLSLG